MPVLFSRSHVPCAKCGKPREPLSDTAADILAAVTEKFGPPTAVTIRDAAPQGQWCESEIKQRPIIRVPEGEKA
jgi:hypothetical protein